MSTPKSVVKISKQGVEYTSSCDKTQYLIFELTRAALRDVGKLCCRRFRESYYQHFKKRTGEAGKSMKYVVIASKSTQFPRVQVGLKKTAKGFYSMYQEFGTSRTPKLGLLRDSVEGNTAEIVKIESQYLSALEDEAQALALIDEAETEGDADGKD